jgi:3-oxoacyl-[acyl-carrier-protein] synthase-1/3-oxoacyl-[acyl-carrier-protein] synthase II
MLATLETNALFAARIRERGAAMAEPRRFPYTSPNAVAGECSIAFGLTGPSFSVGGGPHAGLEALSTAAVLLEAGDADRIVVVAVDEVGDATRALWGEAISHGAVALLLSVARATARARIGDVHIVREGGLASLGATARPAPAVGHAVLVPLVDGDGPPAVECIASDVRARLSFEPV